MTIIPSNSHNESAKYALIYVESYDFGDILAFWGPRRHVACIFKGNNFLFNTNLWFDCNASWLIRRLDKMQNVFQKTETKNVTNWGLASQRRGATILLGNKQRSYLMTLIVIPSLLYRILVLSSILKLIISSRAVGALSLWMDYILIITYVYVWNKLFLLLGTMEMMGWAGFFRRLLLLRWYFILNL